VQAAVLGTSDELVEWLADNAIFLHAVAQKVYKVKTWLTSAVSRSMGHTYFSSE